MLRFETRGTAFERGRQQGQACTNLARAWIDRVLAEVHARLGREHIRDGVACLRGRMARVYPEGHEECCGIAAGLGMTEEDYFAATSGFRLLRKLASCTVVGYRDANGQPVLGKTDDIHERELGSNVLEITYPTVGYRHAHFHFAGSIWSVAGMNEHGLAMGMTGIPGAMLDSEGLFTLDALHTILPACTTIAEVEAHVRALPVNYHGFSLIVGDVAGGLALLEKTAAGLRTLPEHPDGYRVHTNHILDSEFAAQNPPQQPTLQANGERRLANAMRLLQTLPRTAEGMVRLLSDRSPEGPISQHGQNGFYSDFAVVFLPTQRSFSYRAGYPDYADTATISCAHLFGA